MDRVGGAGGPIASGGAGGPSSITYNTRLQEELSPAGRPELPKAKAMTTALLPAAIMNEASALKGLRHDK